MCLVLVGVNMVTEDDLLSASVMFTLVFTQYFVLLVALISIVERHH